MAVVNGTVTAIHGHTAPAGPNNNSSGNTLYSCYVHATFSGTYAQADNAQITSLSTAIQDNRRDGKTVTLVDASCAGAGDEAGTPIGALGCAISTSTLTCELSNGTLTAEHSNAALGTFNKPIAFHVSYILS